MSDVLAGGGSVFAGDNDPEFIEQALPFSLKLMDALLTEQPDNRGLLLAAASGYIFYAYAYVTIPAEEISLEDFDRSLELRARARNLFLRAQAYAGWALELDYPGIGEALRENPQNAVSMIGSDPGRDVEMLYWNAASLGLAISSSRNEPALLARRAEVDAMLDRALELDESWGDGALHEFAINTISVNGRDRAEIDTHYRRALELSGGERAGLFITYAEATAVPSQDRQAFVSLLERALSVDIDANPESRLTNVVAQQRAEWLMDNLDEMFLE